MAIWKTPEDWAYKEAPGSDKLNEQVRDNLKYLKESLPAGIMMPYAGDTAPTQWLICDGSEISRTVYADLFSIIGTTYGSGDGSTTFNLPNSKGRSLVGLNGGDSDFGNLADTPGEKTHKLSIAEMPSHTHTQNSHNHSQNSHNHTQNAHTHTQDSHNHSQQSHNHTQNSHNHSQNAHNHNIYSDSDYNFQGAKSGGTKDNPWSHTGSDWTKSSYIKAVQNKTATNNAATAINQAKTAVNNAATATNQNTTATNNAKTATNNAATAINQNAGGNGSHNNIQPSLVINYIIKF